MALEDSFIGFFQNSNLFVIAFVFGYLLLHSFISNKGKGIFERISKIFVFGNWKDTAVLDKVIWSFIIGFILYIISLSITTVNKPPNDSSIVFWMLLLTSTSLIYHNREIIEKMIKETNTKKITTTIKSDIFYPINLIKETKQEIIDDFNKSAKVISHKKGAMKKIAHTIIESIYFDISTFIKVGATIGIIAFYVFILYVYFTLLMQIILTIQNIFST